MVLVRETSRGRLALRLGYVSKWLGRTVNVFELGDDGWSTKLGDWGSHRDRQGSLEDFLAREIGLAIDEARGLAEEALGGFRDRGGEETFSRLQWVGGFAMAFYALTRAYVLVPLLGVGLLVLLAVLVL